MRIKELSKPDLNSLINADATAFAQVWPELSAKNRVTALIERKDTREVLKAIAPQDIFLTLREVGASDCLEILELLPQESVQAIFDMDGWKNHRVDAAAIGDWVELLFAANPDVAVSRIHQLDIESVSLLLKIHCQVFDIDLDEGQIPSVPNLHIISPDQRLIVIFKEHPYTEKLCRGLKAYLEGIFARDMQYALRLIEAIRWELPSQLEEEALRFRNARMCDLGFPDPSEAWEVFAFRDPDAALTTQRESDNASQEGLVLRANTPLFLSVDSTPGATFFTEVFSQLEPQHQDSVAREVVALTNRLLLAWHDDLGENENLKVRLQECVSLIGIGLRYRSQDNPSEAIALLEQHHAKEIFHVGYGLFLRVVRRFNSTLRKAENGFDALGLSLLDSPLKECVEGLRQGFPLIFRGLFDASQVHFTTPQGLQDIALLARTLTEITLRRWWISTLLSPDLHETLEGLAVKDRPKDSQLMMNHFITKMNLGVNTRGALDLQTPETKKALHLFASMNEDEWNKKIADIFGDLENDVENAIPTATIELSPQELRKRVFAYTKRVLDHARDQILKEDPAFIEWDKNALFWTGNNESKATRGD